MGEYMIRRGNDDRASYAGFRWNPMGEWTEASDWNPWPVCGGGLHGQAPEAGGHDHQDGQNVWLCETEGRRIVVGADKIKVQRARIIAINDLSEFRLPPFTGNLSITYCAGLKKLPKKLHVYGYLDLAYCTGLEALPDGLVVGDSLHLPGCVRLRSLPKGLRVHGNVNLSDCKRLESLPEGVYIGGSAYLVDCVALQSLPEGLQVNGSLNLWGCASLQTLPKGMRVGGHLYLTGCDKLKALPDDLYVGGMVHLEHSGVSTIPSTALIGKEMRETRDLSPLYCGGLNTREEIWRNT
jgi:hypothetical protein